MPRFAANLTHDVQRGAVPRPFRCGGEGGIHRGGIPVSLSIIRRKKSASGCDRNGLTQALFNLPPGNWEAGEKGFAALPDRFADLQAEPAHRAALRAGDRRQAAASDGGHRQPQTIARRWRRSTNRWHGRPSFFAPHGLDVVIEPINPRNVPGYFLNDFAFARDLIVELKIPNLKLQFDIYHCQIIHGDVTMRLREMMPIIGHIQIASIPSRNEPDGEELNYPFLFAELDRLGYRGFVGCEYNPRGKTTDGLGLVQALCRSETVTLALGCIADDYTGASDLANTLTRCGLRTVQTIGVPADDLALPEVDAVVVSLKSRSIEADLAVTRSRAAEKWLRGRGAAHLLFKICSTFNSTDAGNIGPVMDALRADSGDAIVLVTPAFPETGRTVYQGNLFVGSVPLNESPLKDHPLNPMHDSNLVRVLARQSKTKIGLVDSRGGRARAGCGARASCRSRETRHRRRHRRCGVRPRSGNHRQRRAGSPPLGRRLRHRAWIGAGAGRLRQGQIERVEPRSRMHRSADRRPALPAVVRRQRLARSPMPKRAMAVLHLDPERVVAGKEEARRALAWARDRLEQGPVLIASSSTPDQVAALQARHGRDAAGHAIEQAMADIAEGLVQSGVRRLVVAGGETSGAVVDRLRIPGFLVGAEIAAGVPVLRAVGANEGDMLLALKSGNFGGPEFFSDALKLMR